MPFWFLALLFIGSILAGDLLRPRPKDTSKPATLSDFNFPTADESRPIPVAWGTVKIDGPNILWYGDKQEVRLTRNVKSGFFSSTKQTLGFRYSIGIDYALCWGPVNSIIEVRTNNKLAWNAGGIYDPTDPVSISTAVQDLGGSGQEFVVDARTIYGGDADFQLEAGGFGGVYSVCTFYSGQATSTPNAYLASVLSPSPVPAYNNIARVVWQGPSNGKYVLNANYTAEPFKSGYMGIQTSLTPIEFIITRTPNKLSVGYGDKWYYVKTFNTKCKAFARAATTANIIPAGIQTIDGVTLVAGDVVLVKNQLLASQNGLYSVSSSSWTRTDDYLETNLSVSINEGTVNRNKRFNLTTTGTIIVDTTSLTFTEDTSYQLVNKGDANPADCLYELLTNDIFGIKIPANLIDIVSFKAAQKSLFEDGLGFSAVWDTPKQIIDVVNELMNYMDGVLYTDLQTGLITIKLARADYADDNIIELSEDDATITSYSRAAWSETTNEVRVSYIERRIEGTTQESLGTVFKEKVAVAQDVANFRIQDSVVAAGIDYIGPSNGITASKLAYRDLRILSRPLIKLNLTVSRKASRLRPADVFKLSWNDFEIGITNQVFRVAKIRYGNLSNSGMEIEAIEDVFSIEKSIYGAPTATTWEDPNNEPVSMDASTLVIEEAPYYFALDDRKIHILAENPDSTQVTYNVLAGTINNINDLAVVDTGNLFTPVGELTAGMPAIFTAVDTSGHEISATGVGNSLLGAIRSRETFEIKNGLNIALVKSPTSYEIIGFDDISFDVNTGILTLSNVYRGLLDTVPTEHPVNSLVYFINYGNSVPTVAFDVNTAYLAVQSIGQTGGSNTSSIKTLNFINRAKRPLPPADILLNSSRGHITTSSGSDITISWSNRNRIRQHANILFQTDAGIPPEAGTEVFIKVYNQTNTLINTIGPIPAINNSYTYSNAAQTANNGGIEPTALTFHIYTKREGLFSYTAQVRKAERSGVISILPQYVIPSDSYIPRPDGDAVAIQSRPISSIVPTNGQVLTYNATSGIWEPSSASGGVLAGDVTGPAGSNTVQALRGQNIASLLPVANDVLTHDGTNWTPIQAKIGKVYTKRAFGLDFKAGSGSWQEINSMFLAFEPSQTVDAYCTFTLRIKPTNITAANIVQLRFLMNGFLVAEPWQESKNTTPTIPESEYKLITIHGVFKNVAANSTSVVSVELNDNFSGQTYDILERRLTVLTVPSDFNVAFIPTDLGSICRFWFDASRLTGLLDNNKAPQLTDFSGFNRHFTQSTVGNQATYRTNRILNNPAIVFDHTLQQHYNGPNFLTGFTTGEMFIVIKSGFDPAPDGVSTGYMQFGSNSFATHFPYFTGDVYDNFGSSSRYSFNTTVPFNQWNIYRLISANGVWIAYLNQELLYYSVTNSVSWTSSPKIGASNASAFFTGEIAEIILFNNALTNGESEQIYNYLNLKYNLS
jgi:hypothetical protein